MDQLGRWLVAYVEFSPIAAAALFFALCLVIVGAIRRRLLVSLIRMRDTRILRLERELARERAVRWRQFSERLNPQAGRNDEASAQPQNNGPRDIGAVLKTTWGDYRPD
jgi:hypothetical protein